MFEEIRDCHNQGSMAMRHIRPPIRAKSKEIILAKRLPKANDLGPFLLPASRIRFQSVAILTNIQVTIAAAVADISKATSAPKKIRSITPSTVAGKGKDWV